MRLRSLGFRAQELESGPYTFLLSDSTPVAYRDDLAQYRTDRFFSKGTTRHLNQWLGKRQLPVQVVPQDTIARLFEMLDGGTHAVDRRQTDRRIRPLVDADPVEDLAKALRAVLNGGKGLDV